MSATGRDVGAGDIPQDISLDDMDFLELTASQESFITREIQNLQDSKFQDAQMNMTTAAPTENYNFPFVQTSASVHKFQNQRSQCVAPIYYFPNSTVHIHHH